MSIVPELILVIHYLHELLVKILYNINKIRMAVGSMGGKRRVGQEGNAGGGWEFAGDRVVGKTRSKPYYTHHRFQAPYHAEEIHRKYHCCLKIHKSTTSLQP